MKDVLVDQLMSPTLNISLAVSQYLNGRDVRTLGLSEQQNEAVTIAVMLSRLNSELAYRVADKLIVVEDDSKAVLIAPRFVAQWLDEHGVYTVIGDEQMATAVQFINETCLIAVLEAAVVLWDPFDVSVPFSSFETALAAATALSH